MPEVIAPPAPPETPPAADPPAPPAPTPPVAAPAFDPAKYDPKDIATWPEESQKLVKNLRTEAATNRTKATTAEQEKQATLDKIATALGLKADDDPAKAAQTAAEERDAAQSVARNLAAENAVMKAALKAGANPEALADSRSFMRQIEALDPAVDDFAVKVSEAVDAAVKANPTLKTAPAVPARSGGPVGGGTPPAGQLTEEDVKTMTPAQIVAAKAEGRLNHLLGIAD